MIDLELDPPRGVAPLFIGMPMDDAREALRLIEGFRALELRRKWAMDMADYDSGMTIGIDPGPAGGGTLLAVEIYRPERDVDVLYQGISIFRQSADSVIESLGRLTRLDIEDEGTWVAAPDLLLVLVRPFASDGPEYEQGWYFQSVLLAAPGYYDLPGGEPGVEKVPPPLPDVSKDQLVLPF